MVVTNYKQYTLLLDPNDIEDAEIIKFLESKHTKKHKDSYSTIIKKGLLALKEKLNLTKTQKQ